jgi:exodeoxyribonuclease III
MRAGVNFRLLTYNIWKGGAGRVDEIARVIAGCRPDVALLQEATRPEVVAALAERTGMRVWRSFARQSLAYLSREPIAHDQWHRPRFSRHAFIEVMPATIPVRLFGIHLSAVHAAWTERRRVLELHSLLRTIAQHQRGFHLLAGDFNTLAPGAVLELQRLPPRLRPFVWLSGGRIKWRTIQTVIDAGYCDAFRILHPDDPGMTMPSWDPHVRLDYVFVPQAFRERLVSCEVVTGGETTSASDHRPVVANFDLR